MPTDTQVTDTMRALCAELKPDGEVMERMLVRVHSITDAEAAAPPRRRARRRLTASLVTVACAAVAVVAAVALAPDNRENVGPVSARAALEQAGTSAADSTWIPLEDGVYHHVYAVDLRPELPPKLFPRSAGAVNDDDGPFSTSAEESWLARDGSGFEIRFMGGWKDIYPTLQRAKDGTYQCCGYNTQPPYPTSTLEEKLRYAANLTTQLRPKVGELPVFQSWARSPNGYLPGFKNHSGAIRIKGRTAAESFQFQDWGTTIDTIDRLNGLHGDDLRAGVLAVLDDDEYESGFTSDYSFIRPGMFAETEENWRDKQRIRRAIKLLASAPVAPEVRRELFDVLASQPLAHMNGVKKDRLGRSGQSVSFTSEKSTRVPAHTVTLDEVVQEARDLRQVPEKALADLSNIQEREWTIDEHTESHKFYVELIFDTKTGEVLQTAEGLEYHRGAAGPLLRPVDGSKGTQAEVTFGSDDVAGSGGTVYVSRDQSRTITSANPACDSQPAICRPE